MSRRNTIKAITAATVSQLTAKPGQRLTGVRLVVFDVGGTIIEDQGDVPAILHAVLAEHGIEASPAEIAKVRGASKRQAVRHFVGADRESLADQIYQQFRERIDAAYAKIPAIAGAQETFESLKQSGYLLATTTGFDRETAMPIFHRLAWEKYFTAIVCGDDVKQGRPAPYMIFHAMESAQVGKVAEVIAVGDTPLDLQAAANAGLRAGVGVLSGAGTLETLRHEPHAGILPSVAQLPALLKQ